MPNLWMQLEYVGPPEIVRHALSHPSPTRRKISNSQDVADWARETAQRLDHARQVTATFVISTDGSLWIADRSSEHVACAQSRHVLAAGELTLGIQGERCEVVAATNQSTGFCPPLESWAAVAKALHEARLEHPESWTSAFEFRRCHACGATNIVKDGWLWCEACDSQLSASWNYG